MKNRIDQKNGKKITYICMNSLKAYKSGQRSQHLTFYQRAHHRDDRDYSMIISMDFSLTNLADYTG